MAPIMKVATDKDDSVLLYTRDEEENTTLGYKNIILTLYSRKELNLCWCVWDRRKQVFFCRCVTLLARAIEYTNCFSAVR